MDTYAVVRTGSKQYYVKQGDLVRVESLARDEGDQVELEDVLLVSHQGKTTLGNPYVPGAKVGAEVVSQGKEKKVTVFKYKSKTRYRRKKGHRQQFTELKITDISL